MSAPTVNLGDVCHFVRGPFGGALKKEIFKEDGYAVYEQQHAINNQFNNVRYFVDQNKFAELKRFELKAGDLIMSCSGTMGKVAIVPNNIRQGIINQALLKLTPTNKLSVRYLKEYMESSLFQANLENETHGAAIKNVASVAVLKELKIPLPSLAQQQRIAAILDKAAEIKAKREQAIANLDNLVASVFEECCTLFGNQSSVKIKSLVTKPKLAESNLQEVWSLALDQIESNSGEVLSKVMVKKEKLGTSTYYFDKGVVLYSKLRPYLNKVVLPEASGYATTELVPLYCDTTKILPTFMAAYLRSNRFVDFANTNSAGAKMPRVMMDKFWDFEMKLPEMKVQENFQLLCEKCSQMKKSLKSNLEKQEALITSLQHQAFTTGFAA